MTTGERLRSYWGGRQIEPGQVTSVALRYWQIGLIVALIALAAGLRLWDLGERAIHHDESIHIKFAWDITKNGLDQYVHDPVYHGPFAYYGTAATFSIFGDSDYTSRLLPALFGIALVGLPFMLRKQFGAVGTVGAAGFLAVSPTLLYFSRFARNDVYVAFFTLALVVCIWRYLAEQRDAQESTSTGIWDYLGERRNVWLVAMAPLLALSLTAKEVTSITVAILLVFLNIMVAMDLVDQLRASRRMSLADTILGARGALAAPRQPAQSALAVRDAGRRAAAHRSRRAVGTPVRGGDPEAPRHRGFGVHGGAEPDARNCAGAHPGGSLRRTPLELARLAHRGGALLRPLRAPLHQLLHQHGRFLDGHLGLHGLLAGPAARAAR
jgi:hypothetical protein